MHGVLSEGNSDSFSNTLTIKLAMRWRRKDIDR